MKNKAILLPFGSAGAVTTTSEAEFAALLQSHKMPVADVSFTGPSQRAAATAVRIGDLVVTATSSDPMHVKCMVDPQPSFLLLLSGSGRLSAPRMSMNWAAGKSISTTSFDRPLEITATAAVTVTLRPSPEALLAALRSVIGERNGTDGSEADAIMARLLVRGPFLDPGRSWTVDYFSAVMKVVAMFDDCNADGARLAHIGIDGVLIRLLAQLVLEQDKRVEERQSSISLPRSARAVDMICDQIRSTIGSPMSIPDMEKLTGLTGRALNYAFRARFDCSPLEWQRGFLLDHARQLLRDPDYTGSVKSLAYELGFSSPGSFSAFYRQRFAELPSQTLSSGARAAVAVPVNVVGPQAEG